IGFCRDARKPQGITNVVCNVLNLWQLVIVRENHRSALTSKYADFLRPSTTWRGSTRGISAIDVKRGCHNHFNFQASRSFCLAGHNPGNAIKATWNHKSNPTNDRKARVAEHALQASMSEM